MFFFPFLAFWLWVWEFPSDFVVTGAVVVGLVISSMVAVM
jgi:uncharacterized integral membrane protein